MLASPGARGRRRAPDRVRRGDAHALAFADRSFDAVVCLRVLMHMPDWRKALSELCRVAAQRLVLDYPASAAPPRCKSCGAARRTRLGRNVEAVSRLPRRRIARELDRHGFRIVATHRQFVLPIALHKAVGSARFTRGLEGVAGRRRPAAARRVARHRLQRNGARPSHRRDRLHRRPSGADARRSAAIRFAALVAASRAGARPRKRGHRAGDRRARRSRRRLRAPSTASRSSITSPRSIGRPAFRRRRTARSTPPPSAISSRRPPAPACGASCTAARSACTATSSIRRRTKMRRCGPATSIRRPSSKASASRARQPHERASRSTIARPTGIYGPGDRRLLKLFRGVARRRFVVLGSGDIYYHLTYIDDLVEGFRLCGEAPAAANRTYILAGGEVTTLNELVALIAADAGVAPPALHLPVWPFWLAGAACEALCAPLGIEPPIYRRRVDFFTKSRAFDISRARAEIGYAPAGRPARRHPADAGVVPGTRVAVNQIPRVAGPALRRRACRAARRNTRRWSSAGPAGRAAQARARRAAVAERAGRARPRAAQDALSAAARRRAAATSSSARTSCCAIRTRSTSATTSSIDDNCLLDAKGESNTGIRIGERRLHRPQHDPVVQERRHRARRRREHRLQLRDVLGQPGARSGRSALIAAYCYVIGGDHDFSDPSRPVLEQARKSAGVTIGDGAWLGAGAKILDGVDIGARCGRSAPARSCANRCPSVPSPSACRRESSVTREAVNGEPCWSSLNKIQRPAGLRSPRLGRVAHARREAPVRVDDSALRSRALRRLARQPAQEGPLGRNARRARHRHHLSAASRSSIPRRCRRC